jgi:hypothetical protein
MVLLEGIGFDRANCGVDVPQPDRVLLSANWPMLTHRFLVISRSLSTGKISLKKASDRPRSHPQPQKLLAKLLASNVVRLPSPSPRSIDQSRSILGPIFESAWQCQPRNIISKARRKAPVIQGPTLSIPSP